jgi:glutamine amidotransferase
VKSVGIVDYGVCNLDSVERAVEECGGRPVMASRPEDLEAVSSIILPGVGAFAHGMRNLRERGFVEALNEQVADKRIPLLGLCLGMQLLASAGTEGGEEPGLGWIEGRVEKLEPAGEGERVPHIGWNEVYGNGASSLFDGIDPGRDFYFVHSYHFACANDDDVAARTPAYGEFASGVAHGNVMGVQFHPEKSQKAGFQLLTNFLAL